MSDDLLQAGWDKVDYSMRLREGKRKGELEPCIHNAIVILKFHEAWRDIIALDEFSHRIMKRRPAPYQEDDDDPGEWTEIDDYKTAAWLYEMAHLNVSPTIVKQASAAVADDNRFHEVLNYLEGLEWDGKKRLANMLVDYLGASSFNDSNVLKYIYLASQMWPVSAVARIYEPGCKADHVLILEGKEGINKSRALEAFTPRREWFSDTPIIIGHKDGYQSMRGKWIIELPEMESFNRAGEAAAKAFFSSSVDSFRVSYGRETRDFKRLTVFSGTTNESEYFKGHGNRRYWPIFCTKLLIDELRENIDQLWAEAVQLYKDGFRWWPSSEHNPLFEAQQHLREVEDPWIGIIDAWLRMLPPEERAGKVSPRITIPRVLSSALEVKAERMDERKMTMRVAKCLRRLGYKKKQFTGTSARRSCRFYYYKEEK